MKAKKSDIEKDIKNLKRLKDIQTLLMKGDIENAFSSNASKDSETVNSAIADEILRRVESEKIDTKDVDALITLTAATQPKSIAKAKGAAAVKKQAQPHKKISKAKARSAQAVKARASTSKAKPKSGSRKAKAASKKAAKPKRRR
ncbi:hypothetical protein M1373_00040 [Candidatus Marsarchaeota archaeon]|nr:hypothetical protein [Candidatus Marsarchaeota archaeon]MCL5404512.1 hypothetical protein [Candidatus Marsarchaeota archaeon]